MSISIKSSCLSRLLVAGTLAAAPALALAHGTHGPQGDFFDGFLHPLEGIDHVLTMVGVGWLAMRRWPGPFWRIPCAFMCALVLGWLARDTGLLSLPYPEALILSSLVGVGLILVGGAGLGANLVAMLVGIFAIAHGWIHAHEVSAGPGAYTYLLGFLCASAALVGVGLLVGYLSHVKRLRRGGLPPGVRP